MWDTVRAGGWLVGIPQAGLRGVLALGAYPLIFFAGCVWLLYGWDEITALLRVVGLFVSFLQTMYERGVEAHFLHLPPPFLDVVSWGLHSLLGLACAYFTRLELTMREGSDSDRSISVLDI